MKTEILHSPDNGSTASVILNGPLGLVKIQALDAYGFQREMSLTLNPDQNTQHFGSHLLGVYMYPGRHDETYLTKRQAEAFTDRIREVCADHNLTGLLFNKPEAGQGRARCSGFVHLCETIHSGSAWDGIRNCL